MKRRQLVPSLVDHFRPGDDFDVTSYRRTGACLKKDRLDLTAEAEVLAGPWGLFFTIIELDRARKRLRDDNRPDLAIA
jgi:hypothetical protein